jgi:hypothetical protein
VLATSLFLCLGCQRGPDYTGKVSGRVTLDGKPLSSGKVISTPMAEGRGATGSIQSDGTFVLKTIGQEDGVAPGAHRIVVLAFEESDDVNTNPEADRKPLIPARYSDPNRSGLTVDVVAGESHQIELKLTSD